MLAHPAILALLALLTVGVAPARAQQGPGNGRGNGPGTRVSVTPARAPVPPVVDGRLDDEAWGAAAPIAGFVQREPVEGSPVSERTEVRLLVDDKALYVGAWLFDSDPDGVVLGERIRDADLERGDYFSIILDTYRDRQNGFIFSTNPAGIEYDAQVVKEGEGGGVYAQGQNRQQAGAMGGLNVNWDGSWEVAATRDGQGWYAEMRIPFTTLRYSSGSEQTWGMNMARRIRRRNEEAFWSPVSRQFNLMRLSQGGDLEGVRPPAQRSGTVTPFALGSAERTWDITEVGGVRLRSSHTEYPREVGGDAKLTFGSMTLDLTANTDFAQVEVDEQRTNLTRFPLFFPEKRPFFLENAGLFSAGTPQAADLFFTRRIGISDGTPVPILGGGRLSGKVAGVGVGVIQIFTDGVDGVVEGNSFSVARVSRELPSRSRLGAIFVQRRATHDGGDYNRTWGVDGRLGLGEAWTADGWLARTETPGMHGGDAGVGFLLNHTSQIWPSRVRFMQVGEHFNPEVGFVNRRAYRMVELFQERIIRFPGIPWLRETNPHATYRRYEDLDGFLETGYLHLDWELRFSGGGRFGPEADMYQEGLKEPFQVSPGVMIPEGSYSWWTNGWDYGSDPSRPFSFLGKAEFGGFYTGHKYGGNVTFTYRQGETLSSSILVDHNIVRLPQGDFEATLLGLRLAYFFTPSIFVQSLFQYSDQAEVWSANVRFAWLSTAGTGLYVVYNDSRNAERLGNFGEPIHRGLIVKYARQLRLF
ncbi:MAG: carbohydrate binding family 9 domain-containing protein [Longimicrobiales bacterium]